MKTAALGFTMSLFCLFSAGTGWAVPTAENVRVTAKAFPTKATLGDEIRLVLSVERPKKFILDTPTPNLDLAPFEIKRVEVSPVRRGENRVLESFTLVLTVFEMGDLTIPAFALHYRDDTGRAHQVMTQALTVKIVSVGKKVTDKDDIRPIKGPVSLSLGYLRDWALGFLAGALAIFLIVKIILRRCQSTVDPESLLPSDERARRELDRLKKAPYLQERKTKDFYSELSNILRRYYERRFSMQALELTTEELTALLAERPLDSGALARTQEILQTCDLVKFAKLDPPIPLAEELEAKLLDILAITKPETVKS